MRFDSALEIEGRCGGNETAHATSGRVWTTHARRVSDCNTSSTYVPDNTTSLSAKRWKKNRSLQYSARRQGALFGSWSMSRSSTH
eukprot:IDg9727t1